MVTLSIRFAGLCMPAIDVFSSPAIGGPAVHFVMPVFGDKEFEEEPKPNETEDPIHHAVLAWPPRHDAEPDDDYMARCFDLKGASLDVLEMVPAGTTLPTLSPLIKGSLPDISAIAGPQSGIQPLQRSFIDPPAPGMSLPPTLQARVTLRAGFGVAVLPETKPKWKFGASDPATHLMPNAIDWTIDGLPDREPLVLNVRKLADGALIRAIELFPSGNKIELTVLNAATYDLPPIAKHSAKTHKSKSPADHFHGYYKLFPAVANGRVPILNADLLDNGKDRADKKSDCKPNGAPVPLGDAPRQKQAPAAIPDIRTPATDTCAECKTIVEPYPGT